MKAPAVYGRQAAFIRELLDGRTNPACASDREPIANILWPSADIRC
jgi:hypothetical protein